MDLVNLTRRIYNRLLVESISTSELAVLVDNGSKQKRAVVYNISRMMNFVKTGGSFDDPEDVVARGVVEGYILIEKPKEPCNKAWEVKFSVGPSLGRIVYGIGYALSPSGSLISDRTNISPDATRGWGKAFSSDRQKRPLDDMEHPPTGTDPFHDANHTPEDKSDDCKVNKSAEHLNYSYSAEGWEKPMLKSLTAAHTGVMSMLSEIDEDLPITVTRRLFAAANHFFDMNYGAGE